MILLKEHSGTCCTRHLQLPDHGAVPCGERPCCAPATSLSQPSPEGSWGCSGRSPVWQSGGPVCHRALIFQNRSSLRKKKIPYPSFWTEVGVEGQAEAHGVNASYKMWKLDKIWVILAISFRKGELYPECPYFSPLTLRLKSGYGQLHCKSLLFIALSLLTVRSSTRNIMKRQQQTAKLSGQQLMGHTRTWRDYQRSQEWAENVNSAPLSFA